MIKKTKWKSTTTAISAIRYNSIFWIFVLLFFAFMGTQHIEMCMQFDRFCSVWVENTDLLLLLLSTLAETALFHLYEMIIVYLQPKIGRMHRWRKRANVKHHVVVRNDSVSRVTLGKEEVDEKPSSKTGINRSSFFFPLVPFNIFGYLLGTDIYAWIRPDPMIFNVLPSLSLTLSPHILQHISSKLFLFDRLK